MDRLARIASAAMLLTPFDEQSPSNPQQHVVFAYTCRPDGSIESAWGRQAARIPPGTRLDHGRGFSLETSTVPSHATALSALGFGLLIDERETRVDVEGMTLYPDARCKLVSAEALRLLEIRDDTGLLVGVAVASEEVEDGTALPRLSWSSLHSRADVRLCALLALHGQARVARFLSAQPTPLLFSIDDTVGHVVAAFECNLKHTPTVDLWSATPFEPSATDVHNTRGATRFGATARRFIEKGVPIPFVLPAFPCKSPNKNKSSGLLPDKGEDLAAQTLTHFAHAVKAVYPPGAIIHIVSDGHTFSDLLRVPDDEVDRYSAHVKAVFRRHDPGLTIFRFHGLEDLLYMCPLGVERRGDRTSWGDVMRIMLTALWGPRDLVSFATADAGKLTLLRGLSRFMLEDLEQLPEFASLSKSKRKREAMDVALMMISRNESYSQLVDLSFPGAVRLSIHPHNNSGPKFAIALLHPRFRRPNAGELLSDQSAGHTPTPWHNVTLLIEEEGGRRFELMHRHKLMDHRPSPNHELVWVAEEGYFTFRPRP